VDAEQTFTEGVAAKNADDFVTAAAKHIPQAEAGYAGA
jgi:hypothetical protein